MKKLRNVIFIFLAKTTVELQRKFITLSYRFFYFCPRIYTLGCHNMNKRTFAKQIKLFYTLAKLTVELAPKMFSITLPRPYLKVSRFVSLSCATNNCRLKKSLIRGNMAGCRNFKWKCCSIEQIKFRGITGGSGCNAVKLHLFFWLVVKTTSKPGLLLVEQVITCHVALLYG